jgi:aspartate kinase
VPGAAAKIFGALDQKHIVVDLIVQNPARDGRTDLTFTVGKTDFAKAQDVVKSVAQDIQASGFEVDDNIAKVSIVGVGMRNHSGVAARMFQALSSEGINIQMISTSEIKVSCVIHSKYTELAVRALHTAFGLDQPLPPEGVATVSETAALKGEKV